MTTSKQLCALRARLEAAEWREDGDPPFYDPRELAGELIADAETAGLRLGWEPHWPTGNMVSLCASSEFDRLQREFERVRIRLIAAVGAALGRRASRQKPGPKPHFTDAEKSVLGRYDANELKPAHAQEELGISSRE